jgi:hypothetical protein
MSKIRRKLVAAANKAIGAAHHRLDAASRLIGEAPRPAEQSQLTMSDFSYGAFGGLHDAPWRREN